MHSASLDSRCWNFFWVFFESIFKNWLLAAARRAASCLEVQFLSEKVPQSSSPKVYVETVLFDKEWAFKQLLTLLTAGSVAEL